MTSPSLASAVLQILMCRERHLLPNKENIRQYNINNHQITVLNISSVWRETGYKSSDSWTSVTRCWFSFCSPYITASSGLWLKTDVTSRHSLFWKHAIITLLWYAKMVYNGYLLYLLKDLVFSDALRGDSNSMEPSFVQFSYIIQVCVTVVLPTGVIILTFSFQANTVSRKQQMFSDISVNEL